MWPSLLPQDAFCYQINATYLKHDVNQILTLVV
jgi:hypothetical protein